MYIWDSASKAIQFIFLFMLSFHSAAHNRPKKHILFSSVATVTNFHFSSFQSLHPPSTHDNSVFAARQPRWQTQMQLILINCSRILHWKSSCLLPALVIRCWSVTQVFEHSNNTGKMFTHLLLVMLQSTLHYRISTKSARNYVYIVYY